MKLNFLHLLLAIVIAILLFLLIKKDQKSTDQIALIQALNADLVTWKDKDSLHKAKIQILQTAKAKDFVKIESSDSTITELQNLVRKYQRELKKRGSATIFETETDIEVKAKNDTILDTIYIKIPDLTIDTITSTSISAKFALEDWVKGTVNVFQDSTWLDLTIKNQYSVVIGEERNGLFKKPIPFVEVTNQNPYTRTKKLRTYEVSTPRKKKIGIGPVVGAGLNSDYKISPIIGVGVQYSIIKL